MDFMAWIDRHLAEPDEVIAKRLYREDPELACRAIAGALAQAREARARRAPQRAVVQPVNLGEGVLETATSLSRPAAHAAMDEFASMLAGQLAPAVLTALGDMVAVRRQPVGDPRAPDGPKD